jgi:hypothetical protein
MMVREGRGQNAAQVALAENDDMVQTLTPYRTN